MRHAHPPRPKSRSANRCDARPSAPARLDISQLLDSKPLSRTQILAVILTALAMVSDGFDGQLIGYAIPAMMKDWGITKAAFAPVVAAGLIGMALGSTFGGLLGDRIGRKKALLLSVLTFGTATALISLVQDMNSLITLRLLAGLGIGGALPCVSTLTAEFTPQRLRTTAVTLTIICYPLGGLLAGAFAQKVLPEAGWRQLFLLGGLLPLAYGAVLAAGLPESPRFLARQASRRDELHKLLARMQMAVPSGQEVIDGAQAAGASVRASLAELVSPARRLDTLPIWLGFFMVMQIGRAHV
mgnify:CR=1 FL=1